MHAPDARWSTLLSASLATAVTGSLACQPAEISSQEAPLYGDVTYADDCSAEAQDYLDTAMRWGRISAVSGAFAECIDESFRTGLNRNSLSFGPYLGCPADPFADDSIDTQIAMAIAAGRTMNDVTMNCTGGSGNASTGQNDGYGHSNPEQFSWSGWLDGRLADPCWRNDPMDCTAGSVVWPMDQTVGIIWHEASHTHGYGHGANDQEPARTACGYDDDPTWHFQVNTAPYLMGGCAAYVLARSGQACRVTDCGPDALHIIDDLDETGCSCIRDPNLGGGPAAGPDRANLTVASGTAVSGAVREARFTIANPGPVAALDFEVTIESLRADDSVIALHDTIAVSSLGAGETRFFTVALPTLSSSAAAVRVTVDAGETVRESSESDNALRLPIEVPNLQATRMTARIARQELRGAVTVRNTSAVAAPASRLLVGVVEASDRRWADVEIEVGVLPAWSTVVVPYVVPLPAPQFWGGDDPGFQRIGPDGWVARAVANRAAWFAESSREDNVLDSEIVWPDLRARALDAPAHHAHFGAHHLEVGYLIDEGIHAHANLFHHEVRIEDRTGAVLAAARVGPAELFPSGALRRDAVPLDFTDTAGALSCGGHPYNEYWIRAVADPADHLGEAFESNNDVARRFVTTSDLPPAVTVADPGPLTFVVGSPDDRVSFTVNAAVSDPDGDPLSITWSSPDVALHGGTITPGPLPNQATIEMSASALSTLRCAVPGARKVVLLDVTATADDCVLEASHTRSVGLVLELENEDGLPHVPVCEQAYRGVDQLDLALARLRFVQPICPYALPTEDGRLPCDGLTLLRELLDELGLKDGATLPPAAMERLGALRELVAGLPKGQVEPWDRSLALAEIDEMLERKQFLGGAMSALVLGHAAILAARPAFAARPVARGLPAVFESLLGHALAPAKPAAVSGAIGLVPTGLRPAAPKGTRLLEDAPVMALVAPRPLAAGMVVNLTTMPGQPLRLVGFGPKGAVPLGKDWSKTGLLEGTLTEDLWGIGVVRPE